MIGNYSTESLSNVSGTSNPPVQLSWRSFSVIAACIVNLIFALGGTFLNSLVLLVFFSSSLLRSKVSYFLIMVLSCIDLVVVVIAHPLAVLYLIRGLTRNHVCIYTKLCYHSGVLLGTLSGYTLLAMNVERYVSIAHPYYYKRTVTKRKLSLFVGLLWSFVLTSWLSAIRFAIMENITVGGYVLLFFLVNIPIYARIFGIAREKKREQRLTTPVSVITPEQSIRKYKEHLRELKFASTYILILLCNLICYCPIAVASAFKYLEVNRCSESTASLNNFLIWTGTFGLMNSTFNCLIFFWKNRTLRNEGIKSLKRFQIPTI